MPLKKATNTAKATSSAHLRKQLADATAIIARVETLEAELQPEACSRRSLLPCRSPSKLVFAFLGRRPAQFCDLRGNKRGLVIFAAIRRASTVAANLVDDRSFGISTRGRSGVGGLITTIPQRLYRQP
jgi:hypothetical protein